MWGTSSLFYQMFTATILETQMDAGQRSDSLVGILQPRRWVLSSLNQSEVHGGFRQPLISSDWVFVAKWDCLDSPAPDTGGRVASFVWNPELGLYPWLEIFID